MAKTQDNFAVIISGGGLTGSVCALSLASAGVDVLVLDADERQSILSASYDGRASAIALASYNLLRTLGLESLFAEHAQAIWDIRVVDGHPTFGVSPFFLHYSHEDLRGDLEGSPFGYIIENYLLRKALLEAMESHSRIRLLHKSKISDSYVDGGLRYIVLENGDVYSCSLLVGAEGRFSETRGILGIGADEKRYRQSSIVCTVSHECHHNGVAVELFLPSGPFAMLPMSGRRSNVVWSERASAASAFMSLSESDFADALRLRFGDWLGEIGSVSHRFYYPLGLLHAHSYTAERFALIGDSAHAIHPIAGQGVNLGFRDCAALSESVVESARLGLDMGSAEVLEAYARWRDFDNRLLIGVTDALVHLFSNDNLALRVARNVGVTAVEHLPFLKSFLQRHAMGTVGDLPRLLRGDSL